MPNVLSTTDRHFPIPLVVVGRVSRGLQTASLAGAATLSLLLLGYHPFAEDGGIYFAAVEARLQPSLFPHDRVWVTAHTRFALFVPAAASLVQTLHLPLNAIMFSLYIAGLLTLLAAAAHLARTCFPHLGAAWLPVLAVAVSAGLPVAGTGLYAVDPYCTARSLTTPLLLFAFSLALRNRWWASAICWASAATLHPLMAIWAALPLLLVAASSIGRLWQSLFAISIGVFAAAALLNGLSPQETLTSRTIAHTRAYWFPAYWRWYEWIGALAPCALLALITRRCRGDCASPMGRIAEITAASTTLSVALAVCFAHESARFLAFARLQPLRVLHLPFLVFLTAAAAFLQSRARTIGRLSIVIAACAAMAVSVLAMQRSLFPTTRHLEWPGTSPGNQWEQAFLWCRDHTPSDSLFALDSTYINTPGEDSHGFRSIALRSALPDNVKDAGIAAVLPVLSPSWRVGVAATDGLNQLPDDQRRARLLPLGVAWIVLPAAARTDLPCPFHNTEVEVCQLK